MRFGLANVIAMALALTGTAGSALSLLPACGFDTAAGRLVPYADLGDDGSEVWFFEVGEGFLSWSVHDYERDRPTILVLQHCPTGREWTAILPDTGYDAPIDRWRALTEGKGAFTPTQLMQEMQRFGVRTATSRGSHGTCACDAWAGWQ